MLAQQSSMRQVINGRTIEFFADEHVYYVDGIKVPSVTQVVASVLPSQYKDIDPAILQRAADKGIFLHKEIELFETAGVIGYTDEFKNYRRLKKTNQFEPVESEILIYIVIVFRSLGLL